MNDIVNNSSSLNNTQSMVVSHNKSSLTKCSKNRTNKKYSIFKTMLKNINKNNSLLIREMLKDHDTYFNIPINIIKPSILCELTTEEMLKEFDTYFGI